MPELFTGDVGDEVVEGPRPPTVTEVERLERVVHERRHLPEAAAHQLLDGGSPGRIRIGRRRKLGRDSVDTQDHWTPPRERLPSARTHALSGQTHARSPEQS